MPRSARPAGRRHAQTKAYLPFVVGALSSQLAFALALAACAAGGTGERGTDGAATLRLHAAFRGLDCPPVAARSVPPCSGPYAGLELELRQLGGEETVLCRTGDDGAVEVRVAPGSYEVLASLGGETILLATIHAEASARIERDLEIDTGVR